jgi:hypothetical protein
MGVLRTSTTPVGRPFKKGNRGGGRPKGVPNKATQEIKEFARTFLQSPEYRRSLKRRILAGKAPQLEILMLHYGFGRPTATVEVPPPEVRQVVGIYIPHNGRGEVPPGKLVPEPQHLRERRLEREAELRRQNEVRPRVVRPEDVGINLPPLDAAR